jgi:hypothetical protein
MAVVGGGAAGELPVIKENNNLVAEFLKFNVKSAV